MNLFGSASPLPRRQRVGVAYAWEVAKRTTERDRELCLALYRHRILTTEQLELLFFSSRRRAQDRLRSLYQHRVVDRFYPARPFALGKPVAHWLLDEVGAYLVAGRLGLERRQLRWDRQQDFSRHLQLAHRLELNAFVCSLIEATLEREDVWVSAWEGSVEIGERWSDGLLDLRPDAGLVLGTPRGELEWSLEWDRDTEPVAELEWKCKRYSRVLDQLDELTRHVSFVVPSERRLAQLRTVVQGTRGCRHARFWATTTEAIGAQGPLGRICEPLDRLDPPASMTDLDPLGGVAAEPREEALGRRWQRPLESRWALLSPLGTRTRRRPRHEAAAALTDPLPEAERDAGEHFAARLAAHREALLEEAWRDVEAARARGANADLPSSKGFGLIQASEDEEELWR